jgi:hypothetical protein
MRAKTIVLLMAGASLVCVASAQQGLLERSRQILASIGLEDEWRPEEFVFEETSFGSVKVKSKRMHFFFGGPEMSFHSFSWMERLDDLRRRSNNPGRGPHFDDPGEAAARAMGFVSHLVGDSARWRPAALETDLSDPHVGGQMEYQGGAITAKLDHVINDLVAVGDQIAVTFDTMDGKVVSIYISTRGNVTFADHTNLMTAAQAEDKARRHAVQYLRSTMGDQRADEITSAFLSPQQATVKLSYGPLRSGFDSKFRDYTTQRIVPPVYTVDFGNAMVYIHAKTGECVGGDLDAESAGAPARNSQSSPSTGSADSLDRPSDGNGETKTSQDSGQGSLALLIAGIVALVLGLLYCLHVRARRT